MEMTYRTDGSVYTRRANDTTRYYLHNLLVEDDKIRSYQFPNGRVTFPAATEEDPDPRPRFQYTLKDHLGNTVVLFEDRDGDGFINSSLADPATAEVLQRELYYPFGLPLRGTTPLWPNPSQDYLYNGKEDVWESGLLDYGFRQYSPEVGRFMGVDPLAGEFGAWSPYNYVLGNPIKLIDPDGRAPFGDYYGADGRWIRSDGINDNKAYVETTLTTTSEIGINFSYTGVVELAESNSDLMLLAAVSYGESSERLNDANEMSAISSAIMNNSEARGFASIPETIAGFALAATDGNARVAEFNSTNAVDRNGTAMQSAVAGALNAVTGGEDLSNGGTHWAGRDIGSSSEKRATGGLLFTNASHDLQGLGSQKAPGAPVTTYWRNSQGQATGTRGSYNYTWQTTAARGETTFMKKTSNFLNATAGPRY